MWVGEGEGEGGRELAIMSHKFEFLRLKSGCELLIPLFDQVMMYNAFHPQDFQTQTKIVHSDDVMNNNIRKAWKNFSLNLKSEGFQ